MYTEDKVTKELRRQTLTVDDVIKLFQDGQVLVYAAEVLNPATATWEERENAATNVSGIFHALYRANATPEQIQAIEDGIQQALDAGRTLQSVWPTS